MDSSPSAYIEFGGSAHTHFSLKQHQYLTEEAFEYFSPYLPCCWKDTETLKSCKEEDYSPLFNLHGSCRTLCQL